MARTYRQVCTDVGKRLRELRELKGLSRESVVRSANVSLDGLGELERGRTRDRENNDVNPRLDTLYRLTKCLGVDVTDLFVVPQEATPRAVLQGEIMDLLKGHSPKELRKAKQMLQALFTEPEED